MADQTSKWQFSYSYLKQGLKDSFEVFVSHRILDSVGKGSFRNQFEKAVLAEAVSDNPHKLSYPWRLSSLLRSKTTCRDIKASNISLDNKYGTTEDVENDAWDGKMTSQVQDKYAELTSNYYGSPKYEDRNGTVQRVIFLILIATIVGLWFTFDTYNHSSITLVQRLHKQHSPVFIWSSLLEPFCFMVLVWAIATSIVVGASFSRMQSSMLMFWAILMLIKSAESITEVYVPILGILFTGCYMLVEKQPELPN